MPGQESDLAQALIELAPLKHAPVPVIVCYTIGFTNHALSIIAALPPKKLSHLHATSRQASRTHTLPGRLRHPPDS